MRHWGSGVLFYLVSLAAIILFYIFYAHVSFDLKVGRRGGGDCSAEHAKFESVRHWGSGVLFYLVSLAVIILFYIFYAHVSFDLKVGRRGGGGGIVVQSTLSLKV